MSLNEWMEENQIQTETTPEGVRLFVEVVDSQEEKAIINFCTKYGTKPPPQIIPQTITLRFNGIDVCFPPDHFSWDENLIQEILDWEEKVEPHFIQKQSIKKWCDQNNFQYEKSECSLRIVKIKGQSFGSHHFSVEEHWETAALKAAKKFPCSYPPIKPETIIFDYGSQKIVKIIFGEPTYSKMKRISRLWDMLKNIPS